MEGADVAGICRRNGDAQDDDAFFDDDDTGTSGMFWVVEGDSYSSMEDACAMGGGAMASIHSTADNKAASEACKKVLEDDSGLAVCYVGLKSEVVIDYSCLDDCDDECNSDVSCAEDCEPGSDAHGVLCDYCYVCMKGSRVCAVCFTTHSMIVL